MKRYVMHCDYPTQHYLNICAVTVYITNNASLLVCGALNLSFQLQAQGVHFWGGARAVGPDWALWVLHPPAITVMRTYGTAKVWLQSRVVVVRMGMWHSQVW